MEENFKKVKKYLIKLVGEEKVTRLFESIGEDELMKATYGMDKHCGMAYEGSLCASILELCDIASKVNETLGDKKVDVKSIYKVGLLSHISKALMFKKNTNEWEINNRGKLYVFNNELVAAMMTGERSLYLCNNAGIEFSEEEFEAMTVIDKANRSDNSILFGLTPLSQIIKVSYELLNVKNKN